MALSHDPADPEVLRRLIREARLTPNRLRGQNFLVHAGVADALVAAAPLSPRGTVLEIGPGFGVITARLLSHAAKIIAVEADQQLSAPLAHRLREEKNVQVVPGDILRMPLEQYVSDFGYDLVASLPYSITSRVFRIFLSQKPRPRSITVLVQREVALRIVAHPGDLSQLGLLCQLYALPEIIGAVVAPTAFYPSPKVHSAIVRMTNIADAAEMRAEWPFSEQTLWKVIRAGFQNRRKMLKNTLSNLPEIEAKAVQKWLVSKQYPQTARAQDIAPEDWASLVAFFFDE